jgi:hypothetical protein
MAKKTSMENTKSLVSKEVTKLLNEYFNSIHNNRQAEVQEYLMSRVERQQLAEFLKEPLKGVIYLRENHTGRFYWWSNEDIANMFINWSR